MAKLTTPITDVRVANQPIFIPGFQKLGGKAVAHRCVLNVINNDPDWTDESGTKHDGGTTLLRLTAWGQTAELCAKYLGEGKEFSCVATISSYESKIIDPVSNRAVLNSAGKDMVLIRTGFTIIPGTVSFGRDSKAGLEAQKRPVGYDGKLSVDTVLQATATGQLNNLLDQAKQGPAAWQVLKDQLKNLKYVPGMTEFGAAKVQLSPDAGPQPNAYVGLAAQVASATANPQAEPNINGLTYKMMKDAGWTDPMLLSHNNGQYAALVPKQVPAPPVV